MRKDSKQGAPNLCSIWDFERLTVFGCGGLPTIEGLFLGVPRQYNARRVCKGFQVFCPINIFVFFWRGECGSFSELSAPLGCELCYGLIRRLILRATKMGN